MRFFGTKPFILSKEIALTDRCHLAKLMTSILLVGIFFFISLACENGLVRDFDIFNITINGNLIFKCLTLLNFKCVDHFQNNFTYRYITI